jgi:ribosomal protein S26
MPEEKCSHENVELLGEQKGEIGRNKYFRCQKCGNILILSEEGILYEVTATDSKVNDEKGYS